MYTLNLCLIHRFGHVKTVIVKTVIIKTVVIKQYLSGHIVLLHIAQVCRNRAVFLSQNKFTGLN